MNFQHVVLAFFLVIFVSGCSTVSRKALDPEVGASIGSVNAKLSIPADEIIVRAKPSNVSEAMGYGLIPALIDGSISASRQSELEQISSDFYTKVDQIDFRSVFGNQFMASAQHQKVLSNLNISVSTKGLSKTTVASYVSELKPNEGFLGLRIWYEFSADFKNVMVFADTQLSTNNGQGNSGAEPVYKNGYLYVSDPVDGTNPLDLWGAESGMALSKVFADSADEIVMMMQQDIAAPANDVLFASLSNNEEIKYIVPTHVPWTINGFITNKTESRQSIRADTGLLLSVPR